MILLYRVLAGLQYVRTFLDVIVYWMYDMVFDKYNAGVVVLQVKKIKFVPQILAK